jgi:choline-sulfatase
MPPNLLLFLTDDHGAWALGCAGNREVRTPALDRLAAEGARFTNAFTPSPVCSPARACLLTGRTPSQVGIHDWIQEEKPEYGDRDWLDGERTLAEYLNEAGYHCGLSGKWHLGLRRVLRAAPLARGAHRGVHLHLRGKAGDPHRE